MCGVCPLVPAIIYSKLLVFWNRVLLQTFQDHQVLHPQPFIFLSVDVCAPWKANWVMSDWIRMSLYTDITDEHTQVKCLGAELILKQCCDRSRHQKKSVLIIQLWGDKKERRGRESLDDETWWLHSSPDSRWDLWLKRETALHYWGYVSIWLSFLMPNASEWWSRPGIFDLWKPLFSSVIVLAQQKVYTGLTAMRTGWNNYPHLTHLCSKQRHAPMLPSASKSL